MKLEKREVTLNEKDSILDMLFFEENLQQEYSVIAEKIEGKELRCALLRHAKDLDEKLERLRGWLVKTPKM